MAAHRKESVKEHCIDDDGDVADIDNDVVVDAQTIGPELPYSGNDDNLLLFPHLVFCSTRPLYQSTGLDLLRIKASDVVSSKLPFVKLCLMPFFCVTSADSSFPTLHMPSNDSAS